MQRSFRGVSLRQVFEDDMPFLFRLFSDPGRCHLWMNNRRVFDEFGFQQAWSAWTAEMIAAKFIVNSVSRPVGLVFDYHRAVEDGHTRVTSLLEESGTRHGCGVVATTLFVDWLFQSLPLRKVYMEVYAYNPSVVRMLHKLGLPVEGVLKGNRFWDGAWWDLHIFALDRERFAEVRGRVFRSPATKSAQHVRAERRMARPSRPIDGLCSAPVLPQFLKER
jgi:RimJ/RimL family protein N-acetyltransferase